MNSILQKYVPEKAVAPCYNLIKKYEVHLKVVNERVTRHGDYRKLPDGGHQITVNASANKYQFLITLIHEIAHLVAFQTCGKRIKPHGKEWKHMFQHMMLPYLRPDVFPSDLLGPLARHFKNPRASSCTDATLSLALKRYDPNDDKTFIFELAAGSIFRIYNGKVFKRGNRKVKRYECVEVKTGRMYLFQPNAEVELLSDTIR